MTQYSLFNASDYVQKAYDNLVRALDAHESDEIASIKWQLLQAWLSLQNTRLDVAQYEQDKLDVEEDPF